MSERLLIASGIALATHAGLFVAATRIDTREAALHGADDTARSQGQEPLLIEATEIAFVELPDLVPSTAAEPSQDEAAHEAMGAEPHVPTRSAPTHEDGSDVPPGNTGAAEERPRSGTTSLRMRSSASLLDLAVSGVAGMDAKAGPEGGAGQGDDGRPAKNSLTSGKWRADGRGGYRAKGEPYRARISEDGRIDFEDKAPIDVKGLVRVPGIGLPLPILYGSFDLTDAAMMAHGDTLYNYRKLQLMEATRPEREKMAARYRTRALQASVASFRSRLRGIMEADTFTAAEKRALIFELWDECAEPAAGKVDSDEQAESAVAIREIILDFVRSELPAGGPLAYSSEELAELNRRRESKARFAPYR